MIRTKITTPRTIAAFTPAESPYVTDGSGDDEEADGIDDVLCVIVLAGSCQDKLMPGSKADAPSQLLRGIAGTAFGSMVLTVLDRFENERLDCEAESPVSETVILELVELIGGETEAFSEATTEPWESPVEAGRGVIEVLEVGVLTAAVVTTGVAASTGAGAVGAPAETGILPTFALISVERASR